MELAELLQQQIDKLNKDLKPLLKDLSYFNSDSFNEELSKGIAAIPDEANRVRIIKMMEEAKKGNKKNVDAIIEQITNDLKNKKDAD